MAGGDINGGISSDISLSSNLNGMDIRFIGEVADSN